jgi:hypothetical protein
MKEITKSAKNAKNVISSTQFPKWVYDNLPEILKPILECYDGIERDYAFASLLVASGSAMYRCVTYHDDKFVPLTLYFLGLGYASSGKGAISAGNYILEPIHIDLKLEHNKKLAQYLKDKSKDKSEDKSEDKKKTPKPLRVIKRLSGNVTKVRLIEHLYNNKYETLVLYSTEADEISEMFKTEHGNYSTLLRSAFHQELVTDSKATADKYIEVPYPLLSIILTGTPNQVENLIKSTENGLFSRLLYILNLEANEITDRSPTGSNEIKTTRSKELGEKIFEVYQHLKRIHGVNVVLTPKQWEWHFKLLKLESEKPEYLAEFYPNITRMGLICVKIASILTILRKNEDLLKMNAISNGYNFSEITDEIPKFDETEKNNTAQFNERPSVPKNELICSNKDFLLSLIICKVFLNNAESVLNFYDKTIVFKYEYELRLYSELSDTFKTVEAKKLAPLIGIGQRTIGYVIKRWQDSKIIKSGKPGHHTKVFKG